MGVQISRDSFDERDYARFAAKLKENLRALASLSERPGFGVGPATIGTELELNLVDAAGKPALVNAEVLARTDDERLTLEVNRFNLEINARPTPLAGRPFSASHAELGHALEAARRGARQLDARV
ncbi:MAG TPA: hypothetical protein VNN80_34990, partial [Polyangiaceae bacterium]|nr:hypothetical protein [Polyangiaceae bacterium]